MRHRRTRLVAAAVAVLVGTGCSVDPREPDAGDLRRVIFRSLAEADAENALHFTEDEADCIADRVMDGFTEARLEDLGVDEGFGLSMLRFTPEEQDLVFAALDDCMDLAGEVAGTIAADSGLTDDTARCIAEGYVATPAFREAIFSRDFDPALNDRIDAALQAASAACA